jgi:hypothetical protein
MDERTFSGSFHPGSRIPRLRAETPACTKRSRLPKNLFGEQVGEGRHFVVQARPLAVEKWAIVWPGCRPT